MVEDCFPIPICPVNHPFCSYSPSVPSPHTIWFFFFSPSYFASAPSSSTLHHIRPSPVALCQSQPCCSSSGCGGGTLPQWGSVASTEQNLPQNTVASRCPLGLEGAIVANIVLPCESGLMHARYTEKLWSILLQNSNKSPMNVGNWFL